MSKAILEGVAFALKDCIEIAKTNGIFPTYSSICGGGAKSRIWKQIVADVLNIPIHVLKTNQGPSYGAAILAMVGDGIYKNVEEATKSIIKVEEIIQPSQNRIEYYQKKYELFKKLYPALKNIRN